MPRPSGRCSPTRSTSATTGSCARWPRRTWTAAIAYDIGTSPGQSDWAFNAYDADLSSVIAINSAAFTDAIAAGQGDTAAWNLALPLAGAALLAALVLVGVRPRLAEYH